MFSFFLAGWRAWKNAPGPALLAIAALALGIGSTTAIYTVIDAALLKPLPYANPDRYFAVLGAWRAHPKWWTIFSYADGKDYTAAAHTVDALGYYGTGSRNLVLNRQPVHVTGTAISAALLKSFGVAPAIGRLFEDATANPNEVKGALISTSLWRRFGSPPDVVGKPLTMNGMHYTITGVMPGWFRFPIEYADIDVWSPLESADNDLTTRGDHYLRCIAKLKPGVTPAQTTAELNRVLFRLQREYPGQGEPDFITLTPLLDITVDQIRPSLLLLLAAAGALFLITCANVASLLLARSASRSRETAIRVALGATSRQLAVQYFSEGLLVALVGAAIGVVLSIGLVRVVLSIAADEIPRADQVGVNWQALLCVLILAVACATFCSLAPLWRARQIAPNAVLSEGTRASAGTRSKNLLRVFVVAEIALAFGLLALGGAILRQVNGLSHLHPGFEANNLTVASMFAPDARYTTDEQRANYQGRLLEKIRHLPGISDAGFITLMPLTGWGDNTAVSRGTAPIKNLNSESVESRIVSADYFRAMEIPLLAGRFFRETDTGGNSLPLIINQTLAKLYWPHEDPIGSYVRIFGGEQKIFRVVGVVGDVKNVSLARPVRPEFYMFYRIVPPHRMMWAVRSALDTASVTREVRSAAQSIDPEQSVFDVLSMNQIVANSLSRQRLQSLMIGFFAGAALLLAVLGVYGVVAYAVRQRITEMGTRMAVGATPRDLMRLILGDGLKMAAIGIAIGLALVLSLGRVLGASGLHIELTAPTPFLYAVALIAVCTLFACWFPAWRATTLPPMVAINSDAHQRGSSLRMSYRILTERVSELATREHHFDSTEPLLLANIAEASRLAASFPEAIESALTAIQQEMKASAVFLFTRKTPGEPYRLLGQACEAEIAPCTIPADALILNRLRNYSQALPISEADRKALKQWASEQSPTHLPEITTLDQIGACLAAPVMSKAEIVALLIMGQPLGRAEYSPAQRKALSSAAAQIALMLENGRLTDRVVEQETLRRELLVAAEVQKRLFPERWPETASLQLVGMCQPARGVGGDYYDFLDLGNRQIGIALADVAGKGIAAALIMSVVQASLRSLAGSNGASLAQLASKMNRLLHRSTGVSGYATLFYAQYDEEQSCLRYVNAGHNPPLLLRCQPHAQASANPLIEELATGGTIIGMFAQSNYEEAQVKLSSGDVLLLFSDGVSEAHDPSEEEFGEERLKDLLRSSAHLPINEMSSYIFQELKTWMSGAPQHDDLTFVLMKVA